MVNIEDYMREMENIKEKIVHICKPDEIILFGSLARRVIRKDSDIDLCIVVNTEDKRGLLQELYIELESAVPVDLILYTVKEWESNVKDTASFAYKISKEGKVIYSTMTNNENRRRRY